MLESGKPAPGALARLRYRLPVIRTPKVPAAPFSRIKVRTEALVFCGDDVALIRRDRAGSVHY